MSLQQQKHWTNPTIFYLLCANNSTSLGNDVDNSSKFWGIMISPLDVRLKPWQFWRLGLWCSQRCSSYETSPIELRASLDSLVKIESKKRGLFAHWQEAPERCNSGSLANSKKCPSRHQSNSFVGVSPLVTFHRLASAFAGNPFWQREPKIQIKYNLARIELRTDRSCCNDKFLHFTEKRYFNSKHTYKNTYKTYKNHTIASYPKEIDFMKFHLSVILDVPL